MKKQLQGKEIEKLLSTIRARFEKNEARHKGVSWSKVQKAIESKKSVLWSLNEMERTGGEPDVVVLDKKSVGFAFVDCSPESPTGRRSCCYDREGLESRKEHSPKHNAVDVASEMGIELLTEEEYRKLQEVGTFDAKTSSWLQSPKEIRKLGGALFGDFRFGRVFVYHNGAQSYYAARGFRGILKV